MGTARTKREFNLNLEERKKLILYIEDDDFSRETILNELNHEGYNIVAPTSISDCVKEIESRQFNRAVIDNNLSDWVGKNKERPIKIGDKPCLNGLELARELEFLNNDVQIGMFSSHIQELKSMAKTLPAFRSFEILEEEPNEPNKHIINFVQRPDILNIITKPLHKISDGVPDIIQTFYGKKLLNSLTSGKDIWKAGRYSWLVGVNSDIPHRDAKLARSSGFTNRNPEEKFVITLDKNEFIADSIESESRRVEISLNDFSFERSFGSFDCLVTIYFITHAICRSYLTKQAGFQEVVDSLKELKRYAMFESQKILFQNIAQAAKGQISVKEDIYELLNDFTREEFPKILDIYLCRVESTENGLAYVKMESLSPENVTRAETFSAEYLRQSHVEGEDAQFLYTVFLDPTIDNSTSSQIEPI